MVDLKKKMEAKAHPLSSSAEPRCIRWTFWESTSQKTSHGGEDNTETAVPLKEAQEDYICPPHSCWLLQRSIRKPPDWNLDPGRVCARARTGMRFLQMVIQVLRKHHSHPGHSLLTLQPPDEWYRSTTKLQSSSLLILCTAPQIMLFLRLLLIINSYIYFYTFILRVEATTWITGYNPVVEW